MMVSLPEYQQIERKPKKSFGPNYIENGHEFESHSRRSCNL